MNTVEKIREKKGLVRAAVYARFSSDNQRDESIDAQLRALQDYAKRNNIIITKQYVDKAKSATTDNRPEFLAMIEDSKKDLFDIVLVHKLDRFARNRHDSIGYRMELKRSGVRLISALEYLDDESPESLILESVLEAMAEYYSKNLAREVIKGMRENALKGLHTGGLPPLGYDVNPETKMLVINPLESQAVKLIFQMYLEGDGYNIIIDELNNRGYMTKRGGTFAKNSISAILRNEKYTGVYVFNKVDGKDVDGKRNGNRFKDEREIIRINGAVPQIISDDIFNKVQAKLDSRKHWRPGNRAKEIYLLSGKIICGECRGAFLGSRKLSGRNKCLHVTYRCGTRKMKRTCSNKEIRREYIETHVLHCLSQYLFDEQLIPKLVEHYEDFQRSRNSSVIKERDNLQKRIKQLDKEIDNLLMLAAKVNSTSLADKLKALEAQKVELSGQLEILRSSVQIHPLTQDELRQRFSQARGLLASGKLASTQSLINQYVNSVTIYCDRVDVCFILHPCLAFPSPRESDGDESEGERKTVDFHGQVSGRGQTPLASTNWSKPELCDIFLGMSNSSGFVMFRKS